MRLLRMLPWMLAAVSCSSPAAKQTPAAALGVTLFEGARLIIGDGSAPIESSAFIIENSKFLRVGKKGALQVPAGATHVDLTGKTVMPAMVDIHSHLGFLKQSDGSMSKANFNRENVLDHLNRYAYHGFAAVISSGTDIGELPYQLRKEVHPNAALFRTVGRGLAWPGSGPFDPARNDVPYSVTTEAPNVSSLRLGSASVVTIFPRAPKVLPIFTVFVLTVAFGGSPAYETFCASRNGSGASSTGLRVSIPFGSFLRKRPNQSPASAKTTPASGPGKVDGGCPKSPM